ncbi:MAG TPA: nuclear transport factor 2 family protein [Opitutaceae bacterium]|jgi:hypothetical protein|nr:nuclear transport factor 2 family protein [Opitutaceae bacterium]
MKNLLLLAVLVLGSTSARSADTSKYCAELGAAEKNFCAQVATIGLDEAFLANLSDECFIPYRLTLTKADYEAQVKRAREKAGAAFMAGPDPKTSLTWSPSKIEVSQDGTLGYTWGRYDFTTHGKDGKDSTDTGIYLTIWRRDASGAWKVAYDGSPELPGNTAAVLKFLARSDLPQPPKG